MMKQMDKEQLKDLYEAFLVLESAEEVERFMQDLCTPQELMTIAQRYQIAKLLSEDCRYADIVEKTGTSTATISRVNRSLSMISSGGYEVVFDRLKKLREGSDK
ncbi:MAG: YerC/YecD family TrpR-related protein [Oscillospiraceae bacterium]|nr:YerC/YecD family TrpR-related protein [Oscillospiraceae bacterium]